MKIKGDYYLFTPVASHGMVLKKGFDRFYTGRMLSSIKEKGLGRFFNVYLHL